MKYQSLVAFAGSLASIAEGIKLVERDPVRPKVVSLDIQRRDVNPVEHDRRRLRFRKRANTVTATLDNLETLYFANASVGTPEQSFRLHIDTGSSDMWVNAASSQICQARNGAYCAAGGTYSANDSSTYSYVNSDFNISYVDGSGASGDYATDTLNFSGTSLSDFQFGIGYQSTNEVGILGIGYTINEVAVDSFGQGAYPNLPKALVNANKIQANAYSLWLNDLDASTGSILFGGVDTDKYNGSLSTLPIISENGYYAEFLIALTAMGYNGNKTGLFENQAIPVLLDSGSSLTYLPDDVVSSIYNSVGAQYDSSAGQAYVDCSLANSDSSLIFTFSEPSIEVPFNELVLVIGYQGNQEVCIFGVAPAGSSTAILGDTFLRSAYVVYDLDNNEISIAQTDFNATSTNVMEISSGSSGVPGATAVANAVSTAAAGSNGVAVGSLPTETSTSGAVPRKTGILGAAVAIAGFAVTVAVL